MANFEIVEHEKMVSTTHGVVPESELRKHNKRVEEAKNRMRNLEPAHKVKICPLSKSIHPNCTREKCALFVDNSCALAKITGGQAEATTGRRCPLRGYPCTEDCALNVGGGCIITALKR